MAEMDEVVYLVDVDNTLLDNDRVSSDLRAKLARDFGPACEEQYWKILEQLRTELGYADYLGALQRYRLSHMHDPAILLISSFLVDYPFSDRFYPHAPEALYRLKTLGTTAILSDGDVVFQPRKIERSGIAGILDGRALIYIHKERELDDVEQKYPARHYVLIDDKLRILTAVKRIWRERVTTVFVKQGHYAHDAEEVAKYPPADISLGAIGDILTHEAFSQPLSA